MTRITILLLLSAALLVLSGLAAMRGGLPALTDETIVGPRPDSLEPSIRSGQGKQKAGKEVATTSADRPLPDAYRVLLNRSIFARNGQPAAVEAGRTCSPLGRGLGAQWVGPPGTEATLVFRGVTLSDGNYTAFIEDMTGGGVRRFSRGEAIAAGRITGITLSGMDYESGVKVTSIVLGQTLAGIDAPPPAPTTAPTSGPVGPPEQPPGDMRGMRRGRPPGGPPQGMPGPAPSPGGESQ